MVSRDCWEKYDIDWAVSMFEEDCGRPKLRWVRGSSDFPVQFLGQSSRGCCSGSGSDNQRQLITNISK